MIKIEGKLLEKFTSAGIEVVEKQRQSQFDDTIRVYHLVKIPCGREFLEIGFRNSVDQSVLLDSKVEHFKYTKVFQAIYSPKFRTIEVEIQPAARYGGPLSFTSKRLARLFEVDFDEELGQFRFELDKSQDDISVSIGTASDEFSILLSGKKPFEIVRRRLTMRIENIDVSKHDKVVEIIEKIGNSVLFKLDLSLNLGFKLAEERDGRRAFIRGNIDNIEFDKQFPDYEYDAGPMSLYWYAKSAIDMPLLQFLALYQILEFYFPAFSEKKSLNTIRNIIKEPTFNANRDSDIAKIMLTLKTNKNQFGFGSELDQLKSTIQECILVDDLRHFIESDEGITVFYKNGSAKKLSAKTINLEHKSYDLVNDICERIYDIRCRVVHTKSSEKGFDLLVPSSPELKHLIYDISVLEFIAKKVLVVTSRYMKI
ncbi:hypothetical protein [Chitinophaga rhizophila]|uniref:Apea-like HEPN domain-containing protein n=1 Tax=Chitinophaga rhizophila TaxID=2866212 RepID=A0ABS7GAF6_9BACT|nr:hypothetical protein [Chitinophaga rhizophila]MBW8683518.1 hypothetical protein [Chitinophaga rhizophila]